MLFWKVRGVHFSLFFQKIWVKELLLSISGMDLEEGRGAESPSKVAKICSDATKVQ